ncbi:MAG: hypothetical protein MN733_05055, partial [Nitrososphaera sp.]|nr:hypothetical protein [Nitrososphaera sp.]
MTAKEIVTHATQIARVPGMMLQAGRILNQVLLELVQEYDLAIALRTQSLVIDATIGSGPYEMPTNYLRMASRGATFKISGIPYVLVQITIMEYDALVGQQQASSFPSSFATNVAASPPNLFVYPPPQQTISLLMRYYGTIPDIFSPENSVEVPWFTNQNYLVNRVAGELMRISGDQRADVILGDGPSGCIGILRRWLNLQGDKEDTANVMIL